MSSVPPISFYTVTTSMVATPTASSTPSGGSDFDGNTSFVGNTPSTVLFFLALAVGILIASLFVFFTLRYFVRARYGLHAFSITRRNVLLSSLDSMDSIDEQWEFISLHHDYLSSRLHNRYITRSGNVITFNRRRRGRFAKMKKLTAEEVEQLFPKKTYMEWLSSGKKDYTDILEEEKPEHTKDETEIDDENSNDIELRSINSDSETNNEIVPYVEGNEATSQRSEKSRLTKVETVLDKSEGEIELQEEKQTLPGKPSGDVKTFNDNESMTRLDTAKTFSSNSETVENNEPILTGNSVDEFSSYDLSNPHYTSGSCAICLEVIEDDDEVRGLICGHVFHADCLDPWLTRRRACCPMCKRDYYKNEDRNNAESNVPENAPAGNNSGNNSGNERNGRNEEEVVGFNFETFRTDPMVRAMLQELIPPSERVRLILSDASNGRLNLEQQANDIADDKYRRAYKRLWWKIMGISRDDLYNWAVLELYKRYRQESLPRDANGQNSSQEGGNASIQNGSDRAEVNDEELEETDVGSNDTNSFESASNAVSPYSQPHDVNHNETVDQRV